MLHRQVLSPLDLERVLGLTGGHALHGEMAPDQLFMFRPVRGYADYRTPIGGLYLCGAGTHPGGGVTGANGRNCAARGAAPTAARDRLAPEAAMTVSSTRRPTCRDIVTPLPGPRSRRAARARAEQVLYRGTGEHLAPARDGAQVAASWSRTSTATCYLDMASASASVPLGACHPRICSTPAIAALRRYGNEDTHVADQRVRGPARRAAGRAGARRAAPASTSR